MTSKNYALKEYNKEISTMLPYHTAEYQASEQAYSEYLAKVPVKPNRDSSSAESADRYAHVAKDSPTWQSLKKSFRLPEKIKVEMEGSLTKEIPETTQEMRDANIIHIKHQMDMAQIRKTYRQFLGLPLSDSSDSDYDTANLKLLIKKKDKKDKSSLSMKAPK